MTVELHDILAREGARPFHENDKGLVDDLLAVDQVSKIEVVSLRIGRKTGNDSSKNCGGFRARDPNYSDCPDSSSG